MFKASLSWWMCESLQMASYIFSIIRFESLWQSSQKRLSTDLSSMNVYPQRSTQQGELAVSIGILCTFRNITTELMVTPSPRSSQEESVVSVALLPKILFPK